MLIDKVNNFSYQEQNYLQSSKPNAPFSDTLMNKIIEQNDILQSNLYDMDITFRVGECNVRQQDWKCDNFPFWKYFDENIEVKEINNWNKNSKVSEIDIQKHLQQIGFKKMVIIIPENLKVKMEEDSSFAESIYKKIVIWKDNYDKMDNAIAASNGLNVSVYQFSKSYCITLDENGEIDNYTVVSGGLDDSISDNGYLVGNRISKSFQSYPVMNEKKLNYNAQLELNEYKNFEMDYLEAMSILASNFQKEIN